MIVLRPEWLIIAVVIAIAALWLRLRPAGGNWDRLMSAPLLAFLSNSDSHERRSVNRYLLTGAAVAVALSGPAIPDEQSQGFQQLDAWVIALDVSRSMDANDVQPTRLISAREQLMTIAEQAGARAVAVIGFAGDAYLLTPFSTQLTQLKKLLPGLNTKTLDVTGSRIERALSLAGNLLRDNQIPNGRVVLLTDASEISDSALDIADKLKRAGQTLDVLVFATPAGGSLADRGASPVFKPDYDSAEILANAGGGRFVSTDRLGRLPTEYLHSLNGRLMPNELGLLATQPVGWTDISHWLLLVIALPMLWLFRSPTS